MASTAHLVSSFKLDHSALRSLVFAIKLPDYQFYKASIG